MPGHVIRVKSEALITNIIMCCKQEHSIIVCSQLNMMREKAAQADMDDDAYSTNMCRI